MESALLQALGAGAGSTLGAAGRFLEPLDYPRQALWNTARRGGRLLSGQGTWEDALGVLPGLAGAGLTAGLAATGVGLPAAVLAGSALGGLSQGLGKLSGDDAFTAPTPQDLVQGLGGDPESWPGFLASLGVGMAGDPLMYAGMGLGKKAGQMAGENLARVGGAGAMARDLALGESGALDPQVIARLVGDIRDADRIAAPVEAQAARIAGEGVLPGGFDPSAEAANLLAGAGRAREAPRNALLRALAGEGELAAATQAEQEAMAAAQAAAPAELEELLRTRPPAPGFGGASLQLADDQSIAQGMEQLLAGRNLSPTDPRLRSNLEDLAGWGSRGLSEPPPVNVSFAGDVSPALFLRPGVGAGGDARAIDKLGMLWDMTQEGADPRLIEQLRAEVQAMMPGIGSSSLHDVDTVLSPQVADWITRDAYNRLTAFEDAVTSGAVRMSPAELFQARRAMWEDIAWLEARFNRNRRSAQTRLTYTLDPIQEFKDWSSYERTLDPEQMLRANEAARGLTAVQGLLPFGNFPRRAAFPQQRSFERLLRSAGLPYDLTRETVSPTGYRATEFLPTSPLAERLRPISEVFDRQIIGAEAGGLENFNVDIEDLLGRLRAEGFTEGMPVNEARLRNFLDLRNPGGAIRGGLDLPMGPPAPVQYAPQAMYDAFMGGDLPIGNRRFLQGQGALPRWDEMVRRYPGAMGQMDSPMINELLSPPISALIGPQYEAIAQFVAQNGAEELARRYPQAYALWQQNPFELGNF